MRLMDRPVGSTEDGRLVTITIELTRQEHPDGSWQTIDHEPIQEWTRLSITGETKYPRRRDVESCGQIIGALDEVTVFDRGYTADDLAWLKVFWLRWHLNDVRSHCRHQDRSVPWDVCPPCEETGYKAGHRWLVEVLPDSALEQVKAFASKT